MKKLRKFNFRWPIINRKKLVLFLAIVIVLLATANIFFDEIARPVSLNLLQTERLVPIYYVDTEEKKVAFSFDACWGAERTPVILNELRENDIKTTFFLTGFWVEKYPEKVKKIASEGHEIGNHTFSHPHLNSLDEEEIAQELVRVGRMIEELIETRPTLFRPPYGEYSNKVIETAARVNDQTIQWSIDSLDWQEHGKEPLIQRVTENLHPGAIILFHNNGLYTAEALPEIIDYVKKEGYTIVPISELLYKDNFYIDSNTGAQIQEPPR